MTTYITRGDHTATVSTTEYFIQSGSTTQTAQTNNADVQFLVDFSAMAAGDQYQVTVYEKVNAGTQAAVYQAVLTGAQSQLFATPMLRLGDGWDCGVKKLAGTDRSLKMSCRQANADNAAPVVTLASGAIGLSAFDSSSTIATLAGAVGGGIIAAVTFNTFTLAASHPGIDIAVNGSFVGCVVVTGLYPNFGVGTGGMQQRTILAYNAGTKVATLDRAWSTNPDTSTPYLIFPGRGDVGVVYGATAQAGAATTITLDTNASATTSAYNGLRVSILSGTGAGQSNLVVSYVGSTKVATVADTWTTNPDGTSVFVIWGTAGASLSAVQRDVTAATNLKATYNGTGYVADTAPAQQQQVRNIAVTGAALNTSPASRTITTGTESGTLSNVNQDDGVYHTITDASGTVDFFYEFDVSATTGAVGVGAQWNGYVGGVVNTMKVFARNWGGSSWDQVGTLAGIAGTSEMRAEWELTSAHTSAGLVRIRFNATGLTSATVNTDRILVGYAVIPPTVAAIQSGLATSSAVAGVQADTDDIQTRIPAALVSGRMDSSVGTITSTALDLIFNYAVEGSNKFVEYVRIAASALFGKSNGYDTGTRHYRDRADTKNRITSVVDATGRTTATVDGT